MSNFRIDCWDDALEALQQYLDLGLPVPVDITAYLESQGMIVTDQTTTIEDMESLSNG